jgi:microcystin-dependent protein
MSDPFISEIKILSFQFAPRGWALCNGQLLPINQNQALFSLLGTTYGGDGRVTFALPDLRGRAPLHRSNGHPLGQSSGAESHALSLPELPEHTHAFSALTADATARAPAANMPAFAHDETYARPGALVSASPASIAGAGGSQPHQNMQPYLTLNFCIALQGIFPSPN